MSSPRSIPTHKGTLPEPFLSPASPRGIPVSSPRGIPVSSPRNIASPRGTHKDEPFEPLLDPSSPGVRPKSLTMTLPKPGTSPHSGTSPRGWLKHYANFRMKKKCIGDYTLGKKIGQGKFGKVRIVTHTATGETFAMKLICRSSIEKPVDLERIRRETGALTRLRHPHIINMYEVFETSKYICIVMEYASEGDLLALILKDEFMTIEEALPIFRQIVSAIAYCHVHRITHRDLKPENIFLTKDGKIKVGDFGFSRSFDPEKPLETPCGSLAYAAPEILSGKLYFGPQADAWSLGCLLYVMIVGDFPFRSKTDSEMARLIKRGAFHSSTRLTGAMEEFVREILNPNPAKRLTARQILHNPIIWQDKSCLAAICLPFARVLAATQPYDVQSTCVAIKRSYSDSDLTSAAKNETSSDEECPKNDKKEKEEDPSHHTCFESDPGDIAICVTPIRTTESIPATEPRIHAVDAVSNLLCHSLHSESIDSSCSSSSSSSSSSNSSSSSSSSSNSSSSSSSSSSNSPQDPRLRTFKKPPLKRMRSRSMDINVLAPDLAARLLHKKPDAPTALG